jgi:hypothetical protein
MELTPQMDPIGRRVIITVRDSRESVWLSGTDRQLADLGPGPDCQILIDCRRVPPFDAPGIERVLGWLQQWQCRLDRARWALLARPGVQYGAARELAIRAEAHGIWAEAFTGISESLSWLRGDAGDAGAENELALMQG